MKIQELHTKAIELADIAFIKKFNGLIDEAKEIFEQAFEYEKDAAYKSKRENIGEPTISVLLKSAASLAINCDKLSEAEKLICLALSGEPPFIIAEELRNLLEELHFQRHLQLQGITLENNELQFVVAGNGIGFGMVKSDLIFDRINTFEKITFRTVERISGKPFRTSGDVENIIKINFQPYLSVPRAASFAFTIRLGSSKQFKLNGFENNIEIIEDIIENIGLVNNADYTTLKNKISNESYFNNFVGLSKELAPDGEEINLVGLTSVRNGIQKEVKFTRIRKDINSINLDEMEAQDNKNKNVELIGRLFAANEDKNNIHLKVKNEGRFNVTVPDGLNDIVKKYWGTEVKIKGTEISPKKIKLTEIDPI